MSPRSSHSLKPLRDLREQRARGDRRDDAVRRLPAQLLGDLPGDRLRALRVVGAQVDVDERPVALAGELGAQAVDVVVVAADLHDVRAVDAGREDLLLLEVGGDEDVGLQAERRGVGGDGVREVARRRAGEHLEAELPRACGGDADDAVLEGVRRVGGVVLDPDLVEAEPLGEPVGADQRRAARGQAGARGRATGRPGCRRERQEVGVTPDVLRPAPGYGGGSRRRRWSARCGRRRPRADRSNAYRRSSRPIRTVRRIRGNSSCCSHGNLAVTRGGDSGSSVTSLRNWHLPPATGGLPGFQRASPSTPLDVSAM